MEVPALAKMTEQEVIGANERIDGMSQLEMARLWRFAPAGHPYFDADLPLFDYFEARFRGFTPEISKALGWG